LHDLTPQRAHATAIGVYMFATQLLGALGPLLIGRISDISDLQIGLQAATAVMVFGALLMLLVVHFVRRDGLALSREGLALSLEGLALSLEGLALSLEGLALSLEGLALSREGTALLG